MDTILLAIGMVGYTVAFLMVFRQMRWLGRRGTGWPRILLAALTRLLGLVALLFAVSVAERFSPVRHWPLWLQFAVAYGTVGALVLTPWALSLTLWRWRRAAERGREIE